MDQDQFQSQFQPAALEQRISLREVIRRLRGWRRYLFSRWRFLLTWMLAAAASGLAYALFVPPDYVAESTFVLDERDNSGMGQYAGLAALAGISLNSETNSLFAGDNIMEIYKSRKMLQKTLLSSCRFEKGNELLIDRYIRFNHFREKWEDDPQIRSIRFQADSPVVSRLQDSVLADIVKRIRKKNLVVAKPDKKLGIIDVKIVSRDELFSKNFNEKLVENVNQFYVTTRSAHALTNLKVLQQQTDSVRRAMNSYIAGAAIANDIVPNPNPLRTVLHAASQKKTVDIQASSAVYAELLKNLELARINLRKETPLIQLIDTPELPLQKEEPGKVLSALVGAFCGMMLGLAALVYGRSIGEES